jgi:hypothetical protein
MQKERDSTMSYIKLVLVYTSKKAFSKDDYASYYDEIKSFPDLHEAKKWLQDHFYHVKTIKPMYSEVIGKPDFQSGLIFCYNEPGEHSKQIYNVQCWVKFYTMSQETLDFNQVYASNPSFIKANRL